jgi:hypothetical protein
MKFKKTIVSCMALAAVGALTIAALPAVAGVSCVTPGSDNTFLVAIGTPLRMNCADSGGLNATATAPAGSSTSVSTNLLTGDQSQSNGFNASRIAVCNATDNTPASGTTSASCTGAVFHNLFAQNN